MRNSLASRVLAESSAFAAYRESLVAWLDGSAGEQELYHATVEVCRLAHANAVQPEHMLVLLHEAGARPRDALNSSVVAARDRRYTAAVHDLMRACYRSAIEPRLVRDVDGRDWTVMPIREGDRWDPEIEMRRRDWLGCVTGDDRRYISPVPARWEQWSDAELASAIRKARPDLRG
jgi:hypothetical protein